MPRLHPLSLAATLSLIAGACCDLESDVSDSSRAATLADDSPRNEQRRRPGPPALTDLVVRAAAHVDTIDDDDLEEMEQVADDLHTTLTSARPDRVEFHTALADALVDCGFDTARIDDARAEMVAAAGVAADADADALVRLHGLLDVTERKVIVAVIADDAPPGPPRGHIRSLARRMELTDEQIVTIHDQLNESDRPTRSETPEATLGVWAADDFDPETFNLAADARTRATEGTGRFIDLLEVTCKVADDEQKQLLGDALTSPPDGDGHRPPPPNHG